MNLVGIWNRLSILGRVDFSFLFLLIETDLVEWFFCVFRLYCFLMNVYVLICISMCIIFDLKFFNLNIGKYYLIYFLYGKVLFFIK